MAVIGIGDTTPPTLESVEFTDSPSFIASSNESGSIELVTSTDQVINVFSKYIRYTLIFILWVAFPNLASLSKLKAFLI